MDSMRSLNTSLPGASSKPEPSEQLLQAFKAAALSVTQLYKIAATDQTRARTEGYQDALDDILVFLDKENIGLSDGEGWRIRKWATERLSGREQHCDSDEDLDQDRERERERPSSPVTQRAVSNTTPPTTAMPTPNEPPSPVYTAPVSDSMDDAPVQLLPPSGNFTFRSQHLYPDLEQHTLEQDSSEHGRSSTLPTIASHNTSTPTHRTGKHSVRPNAAASRLSARTSGNMGRGAGQKRKINIGDFFDVSNIQFGRDASGGSAGNGGTKRGRFV